MSRPKSEAETGKWAENEAQPNLEEAVPVVAAAALREGAKGIQAVELADRPGLNFMSRDFQRGTRNPEDLFA